MRIIKANALSANQRLDKLLMKYMNKAPKSFIYKMLRKKNIKLNDKRALGSEMLKDGDVIKLFISDDVISSFMSEKTAARCPQQFLTEYEDENLIVVLKPAGLSVQPDKNNKNRSLNDQLLYYLYGKGEYDTSSSAVFKPSVCNRLDRNTAGLVVMAKNARAARLISNAFANKTVEKHYITAVNGLIEKGGSIDGWHTKDAKTNTASISSRFAEGSTRVITVYKPIKHRDNATLLDIDLKTGKSHQIRACMQFMGHSVVGDRKYGDNKTNAVFAKRFGLNNQLLFSYELIFHFSDCDDTLLNYLDGRRIHADYGRLRDFRSYNGLNKSIADVIDYFMTEV